MYVAITFISRRHRIVMLLSIFDRCSMCMILCKILILTYIRARIHKRKKSPSLRHTNGRYMRRYIVLFSAKRERGERERVRESRKQDVINYPTRLDFI